MNSTLSFILFRVYLEIVLGYHSLRILGALNNRLYYFHGLYYFYSYLQEHGFIPYCATAAWCTLVRACLSEVLQRIIHSNLHLRLLIRSNFAVQLTTAARTWPQLHR